VWLAAGKIGVVRVKLSEVSEMRLALGVRVTAKAALRCRSWYSTANEGSSAVCSGFVVGPVTLFAV